MFLIIVLIYFILLILIEVYYLYKLKDPKVYIKVEDIKDLNKFDNKIHRLKDEKSDKDLNITNYIGKFVLKNYYGFFINLDKWNIIEKNKLYNFNIPVNIKILNFKNNENIKYLIN